MNPTSMITISHYSWIVNAIAIAMAGGLVGYILAMDRTPTAPVAAPSVAAGTFSEAVERGNILYDAQKYAEAIPYYQQALTFNPSDVNVSTDLGTALWYSGHADAALAQFERSLAIDRTHAQTLFNIGIVRADGKHNYAGAIAAWETLLKVNPSYPATENVQSLIADAKTKS